MNTIRQFHDVINDSDGYARRLKKESGRKILGYFCSYTPEEIIYAAGVHPMRLFGTRAAIAHADAHLQAYSCSLVRGVLEEALAGRLEFLDGAVFRTPAIRSSVFPISGGSTWTSASMPTWCCR